MRHRLATLHPVLLIAVMVAAVAASVVTLGWWLGLVPPKTVTMASGRAGGGYFAVAERYRRILARDGITLEILETAGSVENGRLLAEGLADVALMQGGVALPDGARAEALAGVFLEPFLIFHRRTLQEAHDPTTWSALRVALGEENSGTRAALTATAAALGLEVRPKETVPIGGQAAAEALLAGEVDVAVFVTSIDAPFMSALLASDAVTLAALRDVEAVTRRLPYLLLGDIPPAAIDYVRRIPAEHVELTAVLASLVIREGLHPAIVDRLTRAVIRVHAGDMALISRDLRFPLTEGLTLPVNGQAEAMIRDGPPPLDGVLPWWIGAQLNRVILLLVPVIVLALPLLRALPGLYAWRMRARVYRHYDELIAIDNEASQTLAPARRHVLWARLAEIDAETHALRLPLSYRERAYALRMHIDLVRRKLAGQDAAEAASETIDRA
ncbi:MAG: TAXI family TRAP transporter solute-binding subunit [Pseudomonadota bacterium]